jgi:predicted TIM-barrel fold metal-dependent hydrolase
MTINDVHCHFFSSRFLETLGADAGRLGWDPPGTPEALADRWVAELDRHEVRRVALIASIPGDEASVATAVSRHPGRFVGFFMLDPTEEGALARVDSAMTQKGMKGICLFPAMHRYRLDDERVINVCERAAAFPGTVMFVHCGVLSVGIRKKLGLPSRFDIRLGDPLAVHLLASTFQQLPFIIPHFGAGFFREALMAADLNPNVYLDTSSSNAWTKYHHGLTLADVFRQALDVVGAERLIFGTDSSFFPRGWQRVVLDTQKTALKAAGADEETQQKILANNFDKLLL